MKTHVCRKNRRVHDLPKVHRFKCRGSLGSRHRACEELETVFPKKTGDEHAVHVFQDGFIVIYLGQGCLCVFLPIRVDQIPSKQSTHHKGIAQSWMPNIVAHGSNQDGQNILRAKYLSCSPCPNPADWLLRLIGSLPWRPGFRLKQVRVWRHDTNVHQE
jgi:hypothetical protein